MVGLERFLETEALRRLADEVAAHPSIGRDLNAAGLDRPQLVEAVLREPGLSESIGMAISELVSQSDHFTLSIHEMDRRDASIKRRITISKWCIRVLTVLIVMVPLTLVVQSRFYVWVGSSASFWKYTGMIGVVVLATLLLVGLAIFFLPAEDLAYFVNGWRRRSFAEFHDRRASLVSEQKTLDEEIQAVIRDKVLHAVALTILERETSPAYDLVLPDGTAAALGEVFDPWFETATEARERLAQLFSAMSGGSIGLSGPRGAGKTTLINHFCRRSDGSWRPRDRPVLAFATPAPARYEARDFVLHLFAALCHTVLAAAGDRYEPAYDPDRPSRLPSAFLVIRPIAYPMTIIGLYILVASTAVFALRTMAIFSTNSTLQRITAILAQLGHTLGLTLGACFLFGGALFVLGTAILRGAYGASFRVRFRSNSSQRYNSELSKQAAEHLEVIHFQRSFTAGWSGTLTLPIGLAGTANEAQMLAERQASLPEIIDRYSGFVRRIVRDYTLVIGIDELDKMKSDEDAEKFLNDNKVLFGLEGCFYLISISESALARFERRGLPLRDVFDSSFDEVLQVGYLDTVHAVQLLRRRVPSLPVPFGCLCHCLAGGLPRDLIRACRNLYLLAPQSPCRTLTTLCHALIREDFRRKRHAIELSAKQLDIDSASAFLVEVNGIERLEPAVERFDEHAAAYVVASKLPDDPSDDDRRLCALSGEFGSYLLYYATLLAFFNNRLDETAVRAGWESGAFDALAKARQSMSLDPKLSWQLCAEFRRTIGLPCPSPGAESKLAPGPMEVAEDLAAEASSVPGDGGAVGWTGCSHTG